MKIMQKSMLVVFCLLSGTMTLGAAWTQKRLTNNTGSSDLPHIAADGSNVYVVWDDDTFGGNFDIYLRKSSDNGATWQPATRLSNNVGGSSHPTIAVNGSNVYVVWHDNTTGMCQIYFRKSTDSGATWQTAKRLTNTAGGSYYPTIAVNGSNVYVVWFDCTPGNPEIYLRKSTDSGATWQTAKRLTNNTGNSYRPKIVVRSSNVYVVWDDDTFGGNDDIYLRQSTDSGATWQTATRLTNNTGNSSNPAIAVSGANVYVVWYDCTPVNPEIYFRKSTDSGATWQTATSLTNNTDTSVDPAIAVYTSNIYVVYENNIPKNMEVYFKKSGDKGATWPTTIRLTNTASASYYPDIALGDGKIYVVWTDYTPGNWEIFLKYSPL